MSWTKRQLVNQAYAELALAGYEFDLTDEDQQQGAVRMEAMLADWDLPLGYAFAGDPDDIDPDQDSGLQPKAYVAVYLGLALSLAAGLGKALPGDTRRQFRESLGRLRRAAAFPQPQQLPNTLPRGAGNRWNNIAGRPFFPTPDTSPLRATSGGDLDVLPE